jgi:hypothetical protein
MRYDHKTGLCSKCKGFMNYEYFKKYHTVGDCFQMELTEIRKKIWLDKFIADRKCKNAIDAESKTTC